jgi:hypothetical protein
MYTRRCPHESHEDKDTVVPINARGNLCDDRPMLSLVNRKIFHDTFYLYYSTKREGLWFKWTILNLDFFPFLCFWPSLTTREWSVEIKPQDVHVVFEDGTKSKTRFYTLGSSRTSSGLSNCTGWKDFRCGAA